MSEIVLSSGEIVKVSPGDVRRLSRHRWRLHPAPYGNTDYVATTVNGSTVYMHRLVMGEPQDLVVDHINGDGLDNRRENLRICTHSENCANTPPRGGTSRYKGVRRVGQRWRAQITIDYEYHHLGYFATEEEAARAYDAAAQDAWGEFAYLNGV